MGITLTHTVSTDPRTQTPYSSRTIDLRELTNLVYGLRDSISRLTVPNEAHRGDGRFKAIKVGTLDKQIGSE
jgi:hypothetical protein